MPIAIANNRPDLIHDPKFLDCDPPTLHQSLRFGKGLGHPHDIGIKEGNPHYQQTSSLGFADRAIATIKAAVSFYNLLKNSR